MTAVDGTRDGVHAREQQGGFVNTVLKPSYPYRTCVEADRLTAADRSEAALRG